MQSNTSTQEQAQKLTGGQDQAKMPAGAQKRGAATRYMFMDVLRVLAFAVILYYHFFKDLVIRGIANVTDPDFTLSMGNIHLVKIAVGMFFMISGVGLAVKYTRMHDAGNAAPSKILGIWDAATLKSYYLGRFKQILIPFYIVYIIYAVINLVETRGAIFGDVPKWRIILTLLGLDNYCILLSFRSFSLGIGEWFLSVLIAMYMLFPLIYVLLKKYPKPTMIIGIVYFIAISYSADWLRTLLPTSVAARLVSVAWHMDPFVKICEFALGVFLGIYLEDIKKYPQLIAVGLLAAAPIHPAIINTVLVLAVFLVGLQLEVLLTQPSRIFASAISRLAGISYYVYLVHHIIIYRVDDRLAGKVVLSTSQIVILLIAELAAMFAVAAVLKKVSKNIARIIPQ